MKQIQSRFGSAGPSEPRLSQRSRGLRKWMDIEKSIFDDVDRFAVEKQVSFAGGEIEVRQYSWSKPVESIWTNGQHCYLLHMALDGVCTPNEITYRNPRRNRPDTLGALALVPPGQSLVSRSAPGSSRGLRCRLDAELFEPFHGELPDWHESLLHEAFHLSGGQIEWIMRRMYREVMMPDFATVAVLEALARQLAAEIVRKFKQDDSRAFRSGGLAPWRMQRLQARLAADQPLPDLAELATLCDMTVRHLSRAFRAETGQTLGKHIEAVMAQRATRMLRGGMTIGEVAARLGFSGPGGFRSAFRRATGLLPGEMKAAARAAP